MFNLRYIILFIPWFFASLLASNPTVSYSIAWGGSILNLILVYYGVIRPIPKDADLSHQFMRPMFLGQLIFVGYMSLSSVFFYFDVLGYHNFIKAPVFHIDYSTLDETAASQRIYSLAHAAYSFGLLFFLQYRKNIKWVVNEEKIDANFFLRAAVILTILKFVFLFIPGLSQFSVKAADFAYISSIISILYKSENKKAQFYVLAYALFAINFAQVLLSGWKEPIIFTIIVFAAYLYPRYKRTVLFSAIPIFFVVVFFLPSFNAAFRSQAWAEGVESSEAAQSAIDAIQSGEINVYDDNWEFLVNRASEISMLNDYKRKVPSEVNYYGTTIIWDSFRFILPRLFWPDKPDIEEHVMKRVYEVGVVNQQMLVSAKPPIVVDAYLSGGLLFVFLVLFAFGAITSLINTAAEYLFCGYNLGTIWIYLGLFQIMNRGNCMEFLVNSIFWGVVSMYIVLFILKRFNYIIPNPKYFHSVNSR